MVDKRQPWVTEEQFVAWLDSLPGDLREKVASIRNRRAFTPGSYGISRCFDCEQAEKMTERATPAPAESPLPPRREPER